MENKPTFIVRAYQPSDNPALRALLTEQQAYEHSIDPYTREPDDILIETYFADGMRWLVEENGAIFVAEVDNKVVGFVSVIIEANDDMLTSFVEYAHITNIIVNADYRGLGAGQRLLSAAEQYARDKGCKHLMIDVLAENMSALKAYQRFGFRDRELLMHKLLT
jgi:ribosomal protein S18 acetylase RimI-like enzyme